MTQDDVIRTSPPISALDFGVPAEFAERAESYARWAVAQEREKRTGIQEFVTLPREIVEQAVEDLFSTDSEEGSTAYENELKAVKKLRAALKQPQNHIKQHLGMVPAGWKLVPVEPNCGMVLAGERSLEQHDFLRLDSAYRAMLSAAPQPPTAEQSSVVQQPQSEQPAMTPIAQRKLDSLLTEGYTISGYSVYHERKHQHGFVTGAGLVGWWKPEGMEYPQPQGEQEPVAWIRTEWSSRTLNFDGPPTVPSVRDELTKPAWTPLYTHPQPKLEPLTIEQIADAVVLLYPNRHQAAMNLENDIEITRAIEAAHNIK